MSSMRIPGFPLAPRDLRVVGVFAVVAAPVDIIAGLLVALTVFGVLPPAAAPLSRLAAGMASAPTAVVLLLDALAGGTVSPRFGRDADWRDWYEPFAKWVDLSAMTAVAGAALITGLEPLSGLPRGPLELMGALLFALSGTTVLLRRVADHGYARKAREDR